MKLPELLKSLGLNGPDIEITSLEEDSRKVKPGALFIARSGTKAFVEQFGVEAQVLAEPESQPGKPEKDCN